MKKKIREFFEEMVWLIKAYIRQPIVPTKTFQWVLDNDCSFDGYSTNKKWKYYWYGDFKTGYEVKIRNNEKND